MDILNSCSTQCNSINNTNSAASWRWHLTPMEHGYSGPRVSAWLDQEKQFPRTWFPAKTPWILLNKYFPNGFHFTPWRPWWMQYFPEGTFPTVLWWHSGSLFSDVSLFGSYGCFISTSLVCGFDLVQAPFSQAAYFYFFLGRVLLFSLKSG